MSKREAFRRVCVARTTLVPWVVAALPGVVVLAVTVLQLVRGWSPLSDDAVIATRAWDVLSRVTPLVGQATLASGPKGQSLYDLGPLYYFLMTLPEHASPTVGPLLGSAVIWLAAAGCFVVAAQSVYGTKGLFVASASLLVIEWQVPAVVTDPMWNPHIAVLWFLSALAALLAVIEGRHRWYPFATFASSFAIQANIVFLVPVFALWTIGTLSVLASRPAKKSSVTRVLASGGVVGVLCWVPAVVQQLTARSGNISSWIWYFSHHASVGARFGLQSLAAAVDPRMMFAALRSHSVVITATSIAGESPAVGVVVVFLLGAAALWSHRHQRPERHLLGAAVLVALSLACTFADIPPKELVSVDYLSVVVVALASVLWILLIVALMSVLPDLVARWDRLHLRPLPFVLLAAAVAMLLARAVDVAGPGTGSGARAVVDEVSAYIEQHVPRGPVVAGVTIDGRQPEGFADYADSAGVVWELRVAGWRPEVYGALWSVFGPSYAARPGAYVAIAHAGSAGSAASAGSAGSSAGSSAGRGIASDHLPQVTIEQPGS